MCSEGGPELVEKLKDGQELPCPKDYGRQLELILKTDYRIPTGFAPGIPRFSATTCDGISPFANRPRC